MSRKTVGTTMCDTHKIERRYRVNLRAIHELCEINYAQLLKIAGNTICRSVGSILSLSTRYPHGTKLIVQEQTRYTTVISLIPVVEQSQWNRQPHLVIRLYHDVRMAEVISVNQYRNLAIYYDYPNTHMHQPDEKYQANQLLNEWLLLC